MKLSFFAAAAGLLSTPLYAHDYTVGDLTIHHPVVFETAPMAMTGGGFMTITNSGTAADRLIGVEADFPRVEIHQTVVTDGIGRMLPVGAIDIAPGTSVTLQPGGYHVMFIGLEGRQLKDGDDVPATLLFETAGRLAVVFKVEKRPEGTGMTMQHGSDAGTHSH